MSPFQGLGLTLLLVSSVSLVGAVVAYFALPKIKANEKMWELFAGYLMVLLAGGLVAAHLIKRTITELPLEYTFYGLGAGFLVALMAMKLYHVVAFQKEHEHHSSKNLSIILFIVLALHEMSEGMAVGEIFFEITTTISITATLVPILILTLHEFPEGLLLVTPFFLEKKIRTGLYAALINQGLFIASGLVAYKLFLSVIEPSVVQEAFISMFPPGAILYLGVHEWQKALEHKGDLKAVFTNSKMMLVCLAALLGVLGSLYLVREAVHHSTEGVISGYEIDPVTGESVPIIYGEPCEHEVNLGHCLIH